MRRADPQKSRREFKSKITPAEASELGVDLGAGANHYRAWVGPPFYYDINGAMQFEMFLDFGLREYHRFLEIGCGSLRVGRLLLSYLLPDRYFGLEPNRNMLTEGLTHNFGGGMDGEFVRLKRPRFAHNNDFDLAFTDGPVDFVVAQSIASHTGVAETTSLITAIAAVCHQETLAMVTYIRTHDDLQMNRKDGWFYPETVMYTDEYIGDVARKAGLLAYRTQWPPLNQRPDGLITTQTPLVLSKKPWVPPPSHRAYGFRFEPVKRLA